jgi:hypothetical protein
VSITVAAVLGWIVVALVLHAVVFVDARPDAQSALAPRSARAVANHWAHYDSWDYIAISQDGYDDADQGRQAAWFPGYAVAIAAVDLLVDTPEVAAVAAAALAGLVAIVLFGHWSRRFVEDRSQLLSLAILLLYPYAWFLYGGAYSTPQFLACAVGAFLALETGRLRTMAVVGAVAMATHPMGIALFIGLIAREAELQRALVDRPDRRRWQLPFTIDRSKVRTMRPLVLAPLAGLAAYMAYLTIQFGQPMLWATSRSQHNSGLVRDASKVDFVKRLVTWDDPRRLMTTLIQATLVLLVICLLPAMTRRFGWGYGIYVGMLIAMIFVGTADFNGSGRYLLGAFPMAGYAAERLAGHRLATGTYLLISASLLLVLTVLFGRSWYLT